jgi:hypothetical protein
MGLLDGILGGSGPNIIVSTIASKMGIPPALAEMALGALVKNHASAGNTVANAASQSGIAPDILSQMVGQIGGTGGLGALVGALTGAGGAVADPSDPGAQAPVDGGLGGILAGLAGGGGAGGGLGGLASMLDRDGDGNPLDDLAGLLGQK